MHSLFSCEPHALQLMIYYDELELCNPLGTKTKVHKMGTLHCIVKIFIIACIYAGIFYYTLANISPKYHSKLRAIQLLAIAKTSIIVKYGADTVLQKFMEELKTLEKVYHKAIIYILKLLSGRNTA